MVCKKSSSKDLLKISFRSSMSIQLSLCVALEVAAGAAITKIDKNLMHFIPTWKAKKRSIESQNHWNNGRSEEEFFQNLQVILTINFVHNSI